jgi:hypothetical protein
VRNLIDNAPYGAAKAKEAGLIDESAYRDDVEKQIKATLGYKETDTLLLFVELTIATFHPSRWA